MSSDIADPSDGSQGELPESPGGGLTNDLSYEDTASDSDDHIGNYFPDDAFCRVSQSLANAQHHNLPLNSLIACLRASLATLGKFVR